MCSGWPAPIQFGLKLYKSKTKNIWGLALYFPSPFLAVAFIAMFFIVTDDSSPTKLKMKAVSQGC